MADGAQRQARRYSAFISYSHSDKRFARRLHRRLEAYRLPRRLQVNRPNPAAPHRLKPVFLDAEELTAAFDLTEAVREAIRQSDFMVVVCSEASAKSVWVGREIEHFRTLHGSTHILTVLIEGTPETCFHAALHGRSGATIEPLAADFRRASDSRRLAFLKIVAPLAGVGLDELVQRDAHRQTRRVMAVAGGAMAGALAMGVLTTIALASRAEAERQRNEAQGLVAYMLTDLRKEARSAGRLDLLATVNNGALRYYRGQDLSRLSTKDLQQRAQLLQAMGEDDEKRGDLARAEAKFVEARRTTAKLLGARPDDQQRIFAHAQSEYWVGFINWRKGDGAAARRGFESYAALARQLVRMDPGKPEWQHEVAYAELNLGTLALRQAGDATGAAAHFTVALGKLLQLSARSPHDIDLQREVADAHAWLADSQRIGGDFAGALSNRVAQVRILDRLLVSEPGNVEVKTDRLGNELAIARIEASMGQTRQAIARLERGQAAAQELARSDPENAEVAKQSRIFELFKVRTLLDLPPSRRPSTSSMLNAIGSCDATAKAPADPELRDFCLVLRARALAADGDRAAGRSTLAALTRPTTGEFYSARWGIDFRREVALAQGVGTSTGDLK